MTELTAKSSVKDIIAQAKLIGITQFIHEGTNCTVNVRLKAEHKSSLLAEISRVENEKILIPTEETVIEPTESSTDEESEFNTSEHITETKQIIKDAITELVNAENKKDEDTQFSIMGTIVPKVISRLKNISDSSYVITKTRSQVFAEIEREYDSSESKYKSRYQRFYTFIRNGVYTSDALNEHVRKNTTRTNENIEARLGNKVLIDPSKAIIKAVETLTNIRTFTPARWREVTQAIKLLTGRRSSEILSSARFVPSLTKGCLLFKGQLKRHSRDKFDNEKAMLIPVIGGHTDLVLQGMVWLDSAGKRILPVDSSWEAQMAANKDVNRKLSMYLTDYCRKTWYDLIIVKDGQTWNEQKKPDCSRDIYTQIMGTAYDTLVVQDSEKTKRFLIKILGHEGDKAVVNYNVDFKCDFKDIKSYVADIDLKSITWQ